MGRGPVSTTSNDCLTKVKTYLPRYEARSGERPSSHQNRTFTRSTPTATAAPERLCDECLTDTCPPYLQDRDEAIVTLAYEAGLRASKLVALDVDRVDLEAGAVFLPSTIQKGSPPPAPLSLERDPVRTLLRYLRDRWKDTPALFPSAPRII